MNAIGLVAFAVVGSLEASDARLDLLGVASLGFLTALGGGTISDVLLDRIPFVLAEDFYASCALIGGVVFVVAFEAGVGRRRAAFLFAAGAFLLRAAAFQREGTLPRATPSGLRRRRPPRRPRRAARRASA